MKTNSILRLAAIPALLAISACGDTQGMRPNIALQNPGVVSQPTVMPTATAANTLTGLRFETLAMSSISSNQGKKGLQIYLAADGHLERGGYAFTLSQDKIDFDIQLCKGVVESTCVDLMRTGTPSRWTVGDASYVTTYKGEGYGAFLSPAYKTSLGAKYKAPRTSIIESEQNRNDDYVTFKTQAFDRNDFPVSMADPLTYSHVRARAMYFDQVSAWSAIVPIDFIKN